MGMVASGVSQNVATALVLLGIKVQLDTGSGGELGVAGGGDIQLALPNVAMDIVKREDACIGVRARVFGRSEEVVKGKADHIRASPEFFLRQIGIALWCSNY